MTPMLPAIGSTIMAAIVRPCLVNLSLTEAKLLYEAIKVSAAVALDTPGLVGTPSVVAPEPACTKKESA